MKRILVDERKINSLHKKLAKCDWDRRELKKKCDKLQAEVDRLKEALATAEVVLRAAGRS